MQREYVLKECTDEDFSTQRSAACSGGFLENVSVPSSVSSVSSVARTWARRFVPGHASKWQMEGVGFSPAIESMKSVASLVIVVLLMVAAGAVLWFAGQGEERLAAAEYALVTLRYERAATELDAARGRGVLEPLVRRISPGGTSSARLHKIAAAMANDANRGCSVL